MIDPQPARCPCGCCDVPDRGACRMPVQGASGRCVYCDHALACHTKKKWRRERR